VQYFVKIKKEERRTAMKMKKFIIPAILVFALTNYAYGMGSHHHHHGDTNSGGSITTDNSGGNEATFQALNTNGDNTNGGSVPVSVPEPTTILLLASGLIGLGAYAGRKFKK